MKPYKLSALAKQDVAEIRSYIQARNADASLRLARRFRETFHEIAANPGAAKLHEEFSDLFAEQVRSRAVGQYVILYRASSVPPEIFAVLHGARDIVRVIERRFF